MCTKCAEAGRVRDAVLGRPVGAMTGPVHATNMKEFGAPWLWLGRWKNAQDAAWLRAHRITHVVNCLHPQYGPAPTSVKRHVIHLNSHDTAEYPLMYKTVPGPDGASRTSRPSRASTRRPVTNWDLTLRTLDAARATWERTRGRQGATLVYCMAGLNRSATFVVAYLAVRYGADVAQVAAAIKAARPGALSNPGFAQQLGQVVAGLASGDPALCSRAKCGRGTATRP